MNSSTPIETVISLTENAAGQVKHLQAENPDNAGKYLRVYVEQGGCSGLQYGMVFDEKRDADFEVNMHGVCVLVDPFSAKHLQGSVVEFSDSLTGGGFKVTNPNAHQSCGCGKSFETKPE